MIPLAKRAVAKANGILHVCGDDPKGLCTGVYHFAVFSTYVEMILTVLISISSLESILHVCGDDPTVLVSWRQSLQYSPRMWR